MSSLCGSGGLFNCLPRRDTRLIHERSGNGSSIFTARAIKEAEDAKKQFDMTMEDKQKDVNKHELPYRPPDPSLILPQINFIEHLVVWDDDLTDLAVRYGTEESEIRRYNRRIVFDNLANVEGELIKIPVANGTTKEDFPDQRVIREDAPVVDRTAYLIDCFMHLTLGQVSVYEARFYLEENGWIVKDAITAYKCDLEWEKSVDSKTVNSAATIQSKTKTVKTSATTATASVSTTEPVVTSIPVAVATPVVLPVVTARPLLAWRAGRHGRHNNRQNGDEQELQPLYPTLTDTTTPSTISTSSVIASAPSMEMDELARVTAILSTDIVPSIQRDHSSNVTSDSSIPSSDSSSSQYHPLKSAVYPSLLLAA